MADYGQYPSLADLSSIYGEGSLSGNLEARRNLELADQFRQEAFKQQQNTTRKGTLENDQSAEMNPLLIDQRRVLNEGDVLANTGKRTANQSNQLLLERQQANQQNVLNEDQRKAAVAAPQHEIDMFDKKIEMGLRNPDPKIRSQALEMQSWLPAILAERRKFQQQLDLEGVQQKGRLALVGAQGQNAKDIAQMNIDAGKFKGKAGQGVAAIKDAVQSGKMSAEKAAVALHGAAQFTEDPELAAKYTQMAQQYEQFAMQQRNAGAGGKLDIGAATGMPTQTLPPALGTTPQQGTAQNPIVLK